MNHAAISRPLRAALPWLVLAGVASAPWLGLYPVLGMRILCFALLACAFNLLAGYGGLISFGHAALFGGAGYVAGHVLAHWNWPMPLGLLAGVGFACAVGLVMALLAVRRNGIYFSMITLALAQIVYFFFIQAPFTGGEDGLQGIPRGTLLGLSLQSDRVMYEVVLAIVAASWWFLRRIRRSPFGQILHASRENDQRLTSLGYSTTQYRITVFLLSAAFAGLAGALKAVVMGFETMDDVHWSTSGLIILMTLVGGLGTDVGPIIGALLVTVLEDKMGAIARFLVHVTGVAWFQQLNDSVSIVIGAIFVLCVLVFRRGLVGELSQRLARRPSH